MIQVHIMAVASEIRMRNVSNRSVILSAKDNRIFAVEGKTYPVNRRSVKLDKLLVSQGIFIPRQQSSR